MKLISLKTSKTKDEEKEFYVNQSDPYEIKYDKSLKVLDSYGEDYLYNNWERTIIIAGRPIEFVKTLLSQLAYYLTYNNDEQIILTLKKEKHQHNNEYYDPYIIDGEKNIKPDDSESKYNDRINRKNNLKHEKLDKRETKYNHLKEVNDEYLNNLKITDKLSDNQIMIHKLNNDYIIVVDKKYSMKKYKVKEILKELLYLYPIIKENFNLIDDNLSKINYIFNLCKKQYRLELTQYEKIELIKSNILNNKPYSFKWCVVDNLNEFIYDNKTYKIPYKYDFDKILVYEQENELYFYDKNIYKARVDN